MAVVTVVGLGPAGPEFITTRAKEIIDSSPRVFLRTRKHPAASLVPNAESFDDIYDAAVAIEDVYARIVEALVKAAADGDVVYVVPGSPLVAETTVELLRKDERVAVEIHAGMSFLDLTWDRLGIDPFAVGPRMIDGRRFAVEAAGERGPLLVAQCDAQWVLSDIKLAFEGDAPDRVTVLQRLGLEDEAVFTLDWEDLDRAVEADHLTSLWIPSLVEPVAFELSRINEVALRLRRDCPWDKEQTHASLARHLIEESYELIDAIDAQAAASVIEFAQQSNGLGDDGDTDLIEELGDVFFQVFAHCAIAEEQGRFNIADVAQGIADKLIERHPHVYGDAIAKSVEDVTTSWEANKKASKGRVSLMDGIPAHLPALMYASKVLRKAQTTGIEIFPDSLEGSGLGGALLLLVDDARKKNLDPEEALRNITTQIRRRFERAEVAAMSDGVELATAPEDVVARYWFAAAE